MFFFRFYHKHDFHIFFKTLEIQQNSKFIRFQNELLLDKNPQSNVKKNENFPALYFRFPDFEFFKHNFESSKISGDQGK